MPKDDSIKPDLMGAMRELVEHKTGGSVTGMPTSDKREMRRASNGKMVPVVPPLRDEDIETDTNPIVGICGQCGMEWRRVMYVSCQDLRCPMQRNGSITW